jgi:broad specificity phosphatase PhoE
VYCKSTPSREGFESSDRCRAFMLRPGIFLFRRPMKTLFLIRHGSTALNEAKRYCGSTDCSLSPKGHRQVVSLGKRFANIPLTCVIHSPMLRCVETATAVAKAQSHFLEAIPGIQEINFADWEGLTFDEAHIKFPQALKNYLRATPYFHFPTVNPRKIYTTACRRYWCRLSVESNRCIDRATQPSAHL